MDNDNTDNDNTDNDNMDNDNTDNDNMEMTAGNEGMGTETSQVPRTAWRWTPEEIQFLAMNFV